MAAQRQSILVHAALAIGLAVVSPCLSSCEVPPPDDAGESNTLDARELLMELHDIKVLLRQPDAPVLTIYEKGVNPNDKSKYPSGYRLTLKGSQVVDLYVDRAGWWPVGTRWKWDAPSFKIASQTKDGRHVRVSIAVPGTLGVLEDLIVTELDSHGKEVKVQGQILRDQIPISWIP